MRPSRLSRAGAAAAAGSLLLFSGAHPITFGDNGSAALQIVALHSGGLTLINTGSEVITGRVVVELVVQGERSMEEYPFTVWGGQKVFVSWAPPAPEAQVQSVGIVVDDGAPI